MDNKELLKKFEERYEVINQRREKIHEDIIIDREDNEEQYLAYEEAAKRNKEAASVLNPRLHTMYEEESSLDEQLDILDNEIVKIASDVVKEIKVNVSEVERKIAAYEKHIEELENEITNMQGEVAKLKDSEEYKSGDEETLLKVEDMEDMIKTKTSRKEKIAKSIGSLKPEIEDLNKQIEDYMDKYAIEETSAPEVNNDNETNKDKEEIKPEEKSEERKQKNGVSKEDQDVVYGQEDKSESKDEQNNKLDEEKDYKALKKDFDSLYKKAKSKVPLNTEDYKKLAEIMQDKENYDKLGITTGVIFNKSKVIFKAMARSATITGPTLRNARDLLDMRIEPANERNGMISTDSIRSWSGLKKLSNNTNVKIASEKLFEEVIKLDRESLTDEQKGVWDNAKRHVEEFALLKSSLNAYSEVVEDRSNGKDYKDNVKKLDAAKDTVEPSVDVVENKTLDLSSKVNDVIEDIPKKTIEDKTIDKEEI